MEIEFFCHPDDVAEVVRILARPADDVVHELGLGRRAAAAARARQRRAEPLLGAARPTSNTRFRSWRPGEFGELEGIAHRGDFDLRSHMEGKLVKNAAGCLEVELDADGKPKHKGSGKDLTYRDDLSSERFMPHVIEPSAGADRATLAFLCEAYHEDQAPDEKGDMQTRTVMKFHPRIAPIKAAVFPLVKKDGMPEAAKEIYRRSSSGSSCSTTRRGRSAAATAARTRPARRSASRSTARRCRTAPSRSATATRSSSGA